MPDNVEINAVTTPGGQTIATFDEGGIQHEKVIVEHLVGGVPTMTSAAAPLPVTDAAVLAKLSADPATQTTLAALLAKIIAAPSTEAKQDIANVLLTTIAAITQPLTDAQLRATPVPISGAGDATAANQVSQTALLTTLNSLIETNNYLVQFLSQLTGAMNAGQPALRTVALAGSTTAVTGSLTSAGTVTSVGTITNFGTGIPASEMAHDINNFTAILANINNVTP